MKPRQRREKRQKTPRAQNGRPFQLANPDLIHAIDHPESVQNSEDVQNSGPGECGEGISSEYLDNNISGDIPPLPLPPPPPEKPALFSHPVTRETLRRKLTELGIASVNKLLRTYTAAELVEAIADFEREAESGGRGQLVTLIRGRGV